MTALQKSPWIVHYDASSCNGCDIEVLACLTPRFDVERLGVLNMGNPKHADILLITGSVNEQTRSVVENIYHQLPEPKVVVAIGICATSGCVFRECYNVQGGVDSVIPVDVYVPGCAARPESIIDGVVKALGRLQEKRALMTGSIDQLIVSRAEARDIPEILALQKIAYRSEAEIYDDRSVPALNQRLPEIEADFARMTFLKAVVNGKIIGSIRGYEQDGSAYLSRLAVHPYFRGKGLGRRLVGDMEQALAGARRYEVFTGHKSATNLALYEKLGYRRFKTDPVSAVIQWVYLEKNVA